MAQAQNAAAQIEYSVYTFDIPSGKGQSKWTKHSTQPEMDDALKQAEDLVQTGKFLKIEVKKKFFDQKTNRIVDMTLKTFDSKPPSGYGSHLIVFFILSGISVVCATAAWFLLG